MGSQRKFGVYALLLAGSLIAAGCGGGSPSGGGLAGGSTGGAAAWSGTKQLGVPGGVTYGYSVATDASGNVYVVGATTGGLDGNLQTGVWDTFYTRYNSSGVRQYTKQFGIVNGAAFAQAGTVDASGNVYIVGDAYEGLDGNTQTGLHDFFLVKYNSAGVKQYTRQLGVASGNTIAHSVAVDTNGNVYVVGETDGGLDGNALMGAWDFFVTKYSNAGVKQYTRQLGVAGATTYGYSVAMDGSGNVYVAGSTYGGLDGNTLMGAIDLFITKYDSAGVKQYTQQLGVMGASTKGSSVATDAGGNIYVAGATDGGLDGNVRAGGTDLFVVKYDSAGVKQYTKQLGAAGGTVYGSSVTTDGGNNVYVAGSTYSSLDGNSRAGVCDFFVTKYNSAGVKEYTRQLGAAGALSSAHSVATDVSGNIFVAGYTNGGLDGNVQTGGQDFFVTKYNSAGMKQ